MPELLLELLSEEIPARMQARAADDLRRLVCDALTAAGFTFLDARSFVTPRRLALVVNGIPDFARDQTLERRGPRVGAPDQAIQGFLKANGLTSLAEATKRDTGKGEFWFAIQMVAGAPARSAVIGTIEDALEAMSWPKSMRWGDHKVSWVRPLHSIVAQLDGEEIPVRFRYERTEDAISNPAKYLEAGSLTRGHRFLSKGEIKVRGFDDYVARLRSARVILDPEERKRIILSGAEELCHSAQILLRADEGLLDEVAGLVEWPVPLLGTIDPQFMGVPPEVLIVSMRNHQRYFATTNKDGTLTNRFVVIANNVATDGGQTIVDGNERVLRARLSDAKFFWDQDRKHRLDERLPALRNIVFHAKLGTVADRVERIHGVATGLLSQIILNHFAHSMPVAEMHLMAEEIGTAARLCKADLVTGMVGEFPELQGIMGGYYAAHDGHPTSVCNAIRDHYAPQGSGDRCPSEPVTVAVALAEKLELLVSFWTIGEKPTSSRDPYGLRRAGLGVIRILLENNIRLSLSDVLQSFGASEAQAIRNELLEFLVERLKVQLRDQNIRRDLIDSVFRLRGADDFVLLVARVRALQEFLGTDAGKNLLIAYSRAANIVRAEEKKDKGLTSKIVGEPSPDLFQVPEEVEVFETLKSTRRGMDLALERWDFVTAMMFFSELRAPIDSFFEKVTVNVADKPDLRLNRLRLLNQIRTTMDSVADFSRIEG